MSGKQMLDELAANIRAVIHDEQRPIAKVLSKLETFTQISRERLVHISIAAFITYLVLGHAASLVCNLAGFVYPAYASMLAIQSQDADDDKQWLTYWTVFALLSLVDFCASSGLIPLYWVFKFLFLLWLYLPSTRGAELLYVQVLLPGFEKLNQRLIEMKNETLAETVHSKEANAELYSFNEHQIQKPTDDQDKQIEKELEVNGGETIHLQDKPVLTTEEANPNPFEDISYVEESSPNDDFPQIAAPVASEIHGQDTTDEIPPIIQKLEELKPNLNED